MRHAAGRRDGLDLVVLLQALQPVPQAHPAAEQDRDHDDMQVVDQSGGKEFADHGGAAAQAHVLAGRSLARCCKRSAGVASMKWNVVPPSISIDGRV